MSAEALPRRVERALLLELLRDHAEPVTGRLRHNRGDRLCKTCLMLGMHRVDVPAAREKLAYERDP